MTRGLGTRYGATIRKRYIKVLTEAKQTHKCPQCGAEAVKRESVGIWSAAGINRSIAASLDDAIKRRTIHYQVTDYRKRLCPEWFNEYVVAVFVFSHVQLADCRACPRPVWLPVDRERAGPADPFAAVVIEVDRFLTFGHQRGIDHIEHLQEGTVGGDIFGFDDLYAALIIGAILTPDM